MNTITPNKYEEINLQKLSKSELSKIKRSLECDISWVEHDLCMVSLGDEADLLLDSLQIYKNLYKKVLAKLGENI